MNRTILACWLILVTASTASAGPFTGVRYWVGEGANEATLVIDFDEDAGAGPALVWGFRWDGAATGRDLLGAVVSADTRLFAKTNSSPAASTLLYGFGYDRDADGVFSAGLDPFGADGFASGPYEDGTPPDDPDDLYAEGFGDLGYWHYTNRSAGGGWASSGSGFANRPLIDGDSDGWVYTSAFRDDGTRRTIDELILSRPDEPTAAPPPEPRGDYNADGRIDAADYVAWRDARGGAPPVAGALADGDLSWLVDAGDLELWRAHYGGAPAPPSRAVPEPAVFHTTLLLLALFRPRTPRRPHHPMSDS